MDKIWTERLLRGDQTAFEEVFNAYHSMLFQWSVKILRDDDQAHDAVQKVFIRLWQKREEIVITSSMKAYLFGSIRNQCLEHLRREKTRCFYEQEYTEVMMRPLKENGFKKDEFSLALGKALDTLPERSREVFDLCKNQGLSQQEAAAHLGIAVKSVANHMGIAVKKLREYFSHKNLKKELFYS